ncbi:TIGR02450 family Trp-rich protein [Polynucleobacter sp. MWH-Berg-3C6]|uniref:TIGR02450 family Trp-rich protein n=1 Tax=Polynucleobacter sp. MWH-Berg-3C6 TaxID=1855882 RepID=UPI0021056758|nr:TIGR02450 family Trp-rich protein [Polynucleobacter sp. MWH-Berg-3C6]
MSLLHHLANSSPGRRATYAVPSKTAMNPLSPKKLLLTKWTAVKPIAKQKHFLVSKVIVPEPPNEKIEFVEIEAVYTKKVSLIAWRDLTNSELWIQGWQ